MPKKFRSGKVRNERLNVLPLHLVTIPEAAMMLGIQVRSVESAIRKGRLKTKVCPNTNQRVIEEKDLEKYLKKWSKRRF